MSVSIDITNAVRSTGPGSEVGVGVTDGRAVGIAVGGGVEVVVVGGVPLGTGVGPGSGDVNVDEVA